MNGIFETHAHLSDAAFESDRTQVLRDCRTANVTHLIEIADGPESWQAAQNLAAQQEAQYPEIFWTCGFHPHYAESANRFDFSLMQKAAQDPRCLAIGEIGLDYFKSTAPKEMQWQLFRQTLEVAANLNKPVVIHCRDAQADTLRILRSFYSGETQAALSTGVIHCFSGDSSFAQACLDLGFFLGVDGPLTYPSAENLRTVMRQVPLDRIVVETDSPYLPPQKFRGKRNDPTKLQYILEALAAVHEVSLEHVIQQTWENARRLYRIKK